MADDTKTLERIYTIPLRSSFRKAPRYKKTNRAVKAVQIFLKKHMKSEDVRMGQHLNLLLWQNGIKNPPPRVTVKAVKDEEGVVRAELEGKAWKESVKPMAKEEEPSTLKDKLTSTLGGKKIDEEEKTEEQPGTPQPDKPAEKKADAKPAKPAEKPATPAKK
ncbi:hypothetical protein GOV07_04390 [Candidatus Woesearchaeota archaeon]|nr:hypothetical protein [Candidatus Woesearchaeota archaeon]